MASLFSGLNTARSGLMASQTALDVTSQNISNANTQGYTRQTLDLTSAGPNIGGYRVEYTGNTVGNGVSYATVSQSRDQFLDVRYRAANSQYNEWQTQNDGLSSLEDIFNEFSGSGSSHLTGLSGQMTDLVTALQSYQNTPTDTTLPTTIKTSVETVTFTVRSDYQNLVELDAQQKSDLSIIVDGDKTGGGINAILGSVADLNKEIASFEVTGNKANDLRDQRNLLLDKLSGYMDITVEEQQNGMVAVGLAHDTQHMLISADNHVTGLQLNTEKNTLYWQDGTADADTGTVPPTPPTAHAVVLGGGSVDGYLQVINGDGTGTGTYGGVGIPYLKQKLNDFAVAFNDILNTFAAEYQVPAPTDVDTASSALVTYDHTPGTDPASTLALSNGWKTKDSLFADNYQGTSFGDYVGELITKLSENQTVTLASGGKYAGSIRDFADSFTGDIATSLNHVIDLTKSTQTIRDNLDSQRQAISSVSIDEEGINIIRFQQAYSASARVITTIDEMLDKLINGTGRVGL